MKVSKKQKAILKKALKAIQAHQAQAGKLVEKLQDWLDGELNDWDAAYDELHCVVESLCVSDFVHAEVVNRLDGRTK